MFTLVTPPESPCGCESGRALGECCMKGNSIAVEAKDVIPAPPKTGQQRKKCLFAGTNDCDGKSGDHIVSASVLRQISVDRVELRGAGVSRSGSPESDGFKVNCLCQRHNSALSPLDTEAGRLFRGVQRFHEAISTGIAPSTRLLLFHTFDIERWLLKTMLAAYRSKVSNVTPERFKLPAHVMSLFQFQAEPPFGLFVPSKGTEAEPAQMQIGRHVQLSLITEGTSVCGIEVALGGLELRLIVDGHPMSVRKEHEAGAYRPKFINFFSGHTVFTIGMASHAPSEGSIWLTRDKDAPIPSNPAPPQEPGVA
jgi:hypothetical protein